MLYNARTVRNARNGHTGRTGRNGRKNYKSYKESYNMDDLTAPIKLTEAQLAYESYLDSLEEMKQFCEYYNIITIVCC